MGAANIDLLQRTVKSGRTENFAIDVRTAWNILYIHTLSDGTVPPTFADWVFRSEIRQTDGTLVATPTCALVDVGTGTWSMSLTLAETTSLAIGVHDYDVLLAIDGAEEVKYQYGKVQIVGTETE